MKATQFWRMLVGCLFFYILALSGDFFLSVPFKPTVSGERRGIFVVWFPPRLACVSLPLP